MLSPAKFAKRYLQMMGVLFVILGAGFLIFPLELSELVTGGILTTPSSVTDLRANYGGLNIGIGLWSLICARRNVRIGALGLTVVFASTLAARGLGIALENHSNMYMYIFLATQIYFLIASMIVWYKVR